MFVKVRQMFSAYYYQQSYNECIIKVACTFLNLKDNFLRPCSSGAGFWRAPSRGQNCLILVVIENC